MLRSSAQHGVSMNSILMIIVGLLVIGFAEVPVFEDPVYIEANGTPINVGYGGNASPFMIDWDGDNNQDLLLGQYDGGKIRFYANAGTNFNPTFTTFTYLKADGVDIAVSYG